LAACPESVDCRAVTLVEADLFYLATRVQRATTRQANRIWDISYTFTSSKAKPIPSASTRGRTLNLRARLRRHNTGQVPDTAKWKPWQIKTYIVHACARAWHRPRPGQHRRRTDPRELSRILSSD